MSYGIIYKAVSPDGKVYIGQTVKPLKKRKSEHKARTIYKDLRTTFQIALLNIGFSNFAWEQVDMADSKEELETKEKYWIKYYKSDNPANGYNMQSGGKHYKPSEITKRKLSELNKGKSMPHEHYLKLSKLFRGEKSPSAKLTELQVIEILKALARGESNKSLIKKYGVSPATISNIKNGNRWTHVQLPEAI